MTHSVPFSPSSSRYVIGFSLPADSNTGRREATVALYTQILTSNWATVSQVSEGNTAGVIHYRWLWERKQTDLQWILLMSLSVPFPVPWRAGSFSWTRTRTRTRIRTTPQWLRQRWSEINTNTLYHLRRKHGALDENQIKILIKSSCGSIYDLTEDEVEVMKCPLTVGLLRSLFRADQMGVTSRLAVPSKL